MNYARSCSGFVAEMNFLLWLQEQSLSVRYEAEQKQQEVVTAKIFKDEKRILASGSGKGLHYRIGAIAEAIEHLHVADISFQQTMTHMKLVRNL